jgi:hypothetical protein
VPVEADEVWLRHRFARGIRGSAPPYQESPNGRMFKAAGAED